MSKRILVIVSVLLTPAVVFLISRGQSPESNVSRRQAEIEAVRRGGLREAARISGRYETVLRTSQWGKYDLDSLTSHSSNVVIGTPLASAAYLSQDGDNITTDYRFKVVTSLKGSLQSEEIVVISLPGGKVVFEDGTSAEVKTPDLEGMTTGDTYVVFLSPKPTSRGALTVTGIGQGLFQLNTEKHVVKPHGQPSDLIQKHKDEDVEQFLREIKRSVKKYPDLSICCDQ